MSQNYRKKMAILAAFSMLAATSHLTFELSLPRVQMVELPLLNAALINLNPNANRWFVFEIKQPRQLRFHLENADIKTNVALDFDGFRFSAPNRGEYSCKLWDAKGITEFESQAVTESNLPFVPFCEGRLYLRLQKQSKTVLTNTEWATEILRKTSVGEQVINALKPVIVDLESETASGSKDQKKLHLVEDLAKDKNPDYPSSAKMRSGELILAGENDLGISIANDEKNIRYGLWYPASLAQHTYISLFTPRLVDPKSLQDQESALYEIEPGEEDKLIYLIAYDLTHYTIEYVIGTEQPGINTEDDTYGSLVDLRKSLVPIGSIPPYDLKNSIGVFIGGFKQRHSFFRAGPLKGKSYGYIQAGVELAPMDSGIATILAKTDGTVDIIDWPEDEREQQNLRSKVLSARQNGATLLKDSKVGELVKDWRGGNWSADANGLRRSLRSGVCVAENSEKHPFLIFMAFTLATPSTMARVMDAYHCKSGMHLDMNALMYLHNALFNLKDDGNLTVEYLSKEMLYPPGLKLHRFIQDNNYRDFFYVRTRKPTFSFGTSQGNSK